MTNLIEKQIKFILINLILLISTNVYSSTIYINISGNDITDGLYVQHDNTVTSSSWDFAPNLLPVSSWVPFNESQKVNLKFKSNTGDSVSFNTKITGFDFGFKKDKIKVDSYNKGTCKENTINSDGVFVFDPSSCLSKYKVTSTAASKIKPFNLIRPYIDISALISSFNGHDKGIYKADISYKVKYYYEIDGVISYRDFYRNLSLVINYNPIELISIRKVGDGVIKDLVYDQKRLTVSGSTTYKIMVSGFVPYGLQMAFDNNDKSDTRYLIKNKGTNTEIPYYIKCDQCNNKLIVDYNGYRVKLDDEIINFSNKYDKYHEFNIDVGIRDIKSKTVKSARYIGMFNVYFQAIM
ncbi:hypothetical protein [Photobacterium damselae]|uniref:hypothetical protein n=1 Tax=Photobacterium damselae TaxID=38293 RepID=UPI001F2812F7|nr:hypothetical protein [Photobacterium damselae]UKA11861.1 hypothetical protein IHC91_18965 [Photobacterium damselae subsp. damselae]